VGSISDKAGSISNPTTGSISKDAGSISYPSGGTITTDGGSSPPPVNPDAVLYLRSVAEKGETAETLLLRTIEEKENG